VCNTGVRLTPIVDGRRLHLEFRGLYDAVSILWDRETGSLWNHITGKAVHGPLTGRTLAPIGNLLHTTVEEALAGDPDLRVANSNRPIGQESRWAPWIERVPVLGPAFRRTMGTEDTRRPTMDVGLGVWIDSAVRYYPLEAIAAADNALIDTLAGRRLLVFVPRSGSAPQALYTSATSARWDGDTLRLSTGAAVDAAGIVDANGRRRPVDRPLQVFTRWYGFALTFPQTSVYER
jgi:hypothetical protein